MDENINQILDLFPNLSIENIKKALDAHNNNIDDTINHILTGGDLDNNHSNEHADGEHNNNDNNQNETEEQRNERLLMEMLRQEQEEQNLVNQSKTHYCTICLDDLTIDQFYIVDECEHRFCTGCLTYHIQTQVNMRFPSVKCPFTTCKRLMSYEEVKHLLSVQEFEVYDGILLESSLKKDRNVIHCPYPDCKNQNIVNLKEDTEMECTDCGYKCCLGCRDEAHFGLSCEDWADFKEYLRENTYVESLPAPQRVFQQEPAPPVAEYQSYKTYRRNRPLWKDRKWKTKNYRSAVVEHMGKFFDRGHRKGHQKLFLQWISKNTTPCPNCLVIIEKNGGCNDMTCERCFTRFCYGCGTNYNIHEHMNYPCQRRTFNGDDYYDIFS